MSLMYIRFCVVLAGVAVLSGRVAGLRGSALVAELKAKAKAALLNPPEETPVTLDGEESNSTEALNGTEATNSTKLTKLTGNPQKDYIYDPNLPRELNGYNLSSYPFYDRVPEDIDFKCDDLHDGFYASVPHKCQVYHHCLFGTRYDFLCANYTAFDQRTFICHFVSEVDCVNSPKFFQRNEALYKAASTAPPPPPPTTAPPPPPPSPPPPPTTPRPRRRRPYRRRRPAYEYYYDDQYDDEEYYDDDPPPPVRRKMNRKQRPQGGYREDEDDYYDGRRDSSRGESSRAESSRGDRGESSKNEGSARNSGSESSREVKPTVRISGPAAGTVYDRPRVPPKIRRPVPVHERDKYDYKTSGGDPVSTEETKKPSKTQKPDQDEDEYYDDDYEEDYSKPPPKRSKTNTGYSSESSGKVNSRRANGRHRPRQQSHRRPDRYDEDYEEEPPVRSRKRPRHEETPQTGRGHRGSYRGHSRDEPDPVPADRPGFISGRYPSGNRKRAEDDRSSTSTTKKPPRVIYDDEEEDEEYYDEEEDVQEDDSSSRSNRKPVSQNTRGSVDYPTDNGRKQSTSNRKHYSDAPTSKPSLRNDQGGSSRNDDGKPKNRQKPQVSQFPKNDKDGCKNNCEYESDEIIIENPKQDKRYEEERETQKQVNDRLFSSRFRETMNDSKTKHQSYEPEIQGRPSSFQPSHRPTNQHPEQHQRYKPLTVKTNDDDISDNLKSSTTPDYFEENPSSKFYNFRSKGRVVSSTPMTNTYKQAITTEQTFETAEASSSSKESEPKNTSFDESTYSLPNKQFSPRPFSGVARRPVKSTTEPPQYDEYEVSPKSTTSGYFRQPALASEENDRSVKKPTSSGQNYRRINYNAKPSQVENDEIDQSKFSNSGGNYRGSFKPVEETVQENNPLTNDDQKDAQSTDDGLRKGNRQNTASRLQSEEYESEEGYRRDKVSAIPTPMPETDRSTSSYYESPQLPTGVSPTSSLTNKKRPYLVARPLNTNPSSVEDTSKNTRPSNGQFQRPLKQRTQNTEPVTGLEGYSPTSLAGGFNENYRKTETGLGANSRPSFGYFPAKRVKVRIGENLARGLEQYPKQLTLNQEDQFSKQLPKIDITAPGPSAPDSDVTAAKPNYKNNYNNGPPGFSLDIPEEEYDVTLNDALQPSTLHPTRSLVDYQQTKLKNRDFGQNPENVYRGRVSYLVPAASQQVQRVYPAVPASSKDNLEEYEAVVLTASSGRTGSPTEWYW